MFITWASRKLGFFRFFLGRAFAFAGLAVGFILQSPWTRAREAKGFFALGVVGVALVLFSRWLDGSPRQLYPVYDYWHTSPEFFLIRLGMLMVILRDVCVVPLGCRPVGLQPGDPVGAGVSAGVLGAH